MLVLKIVNLITILTLLFAIGTKAQTNTYEMKPKYYDVNPNDGIMDPGTQFNPYEIKPKYGTGNTYELKPKYYDVNPNDGIMDPGSSVNPYQISP